MKQFINTSPQLSSVSFTGIKGRPVSENFSKGVFLLQIVSCLCLL